MRFDFPMRRVVRQLSKFFHQEDQEIEWMDHALNYSEVLHPADLRPLTSKCPWCSYALPKNLQRIWKLCVKIVFGQAKFCSLAKAEQIIWESFQGSELQGANSLCYTVFGARFVSKWTQRQKDTHYILHQEHLLLETDNRRGSIFSHQVQGHLSRKVATVIPELSTLFPNPIV